MTRAHELSSPCRRAYRDSTACLRPRLIDICRVGLDCTCTDGDFNLFFFFFYPCIPALVLGRGGAGGSFGAWAGVRRLGGLLSFLGAVSIQNTFGQFALRCGPGKDLIFMWTSCRAVWSLSASFQPPTRAAVLMSRLAEFPRRSEQFLCFFFPCIFFPSFSSRKIQTLIAYHPHTATTALHRVLCPLCARGADKSITPAAGLYFTFSCNWHTAELVAHSVHREYDPVYDPVYTWNLKLFGQCWIVNVGKRFLFIYFRLILPMIDVKQERPVGETCGAGHKPHTKSPLPPAGAQCAIVLSAIARSESNRKYKRVDCLLSV